MACSAAAASCLSRCSCHSCHSLAEYSTTKSPTISLTAASSPGCKSASLSKTKRSAVADTSSLSSLSKGKAGTLPHPEPSSTMLDSKISRTNTLDSTVCTPPCWMVMGSCTKSRCTIGPGRGTAWSPNAMWATCTVSANSASCSASSGSTPSLTNSLGSANAPAPCWARKGNRTRSPCTSGTGPGNASKANRSNNWSVSGPLPRCGRSLSPNCWSKAATSAMTSPYKEHSMR
mmetsp:Transcript_37356/g.120345  ORF Transcript_37356/g.120345 Transcript_37356/m.120345 type:complete len:232 (-) Transcript_37356:69-764(-)